MNTSTSTPTTTETKRCPTCGVEKPLTDFSGDGKQRKRYRIQCAECRELYRLGPKDSATKVVEVPQVVWPKDPEGRLRIAVGLRMEAYKERAIDAIFDLALMPQNENPLLMQVKLAAAAKLAGPLPGDAAFAGRAGQQPLELDPFLKQLNETFNASKPRLREIRERVAVFEETPEAAVPALPQPD